jgi:hypothetical protein
VSDDLDKASARLPQSTDDEWNEEHLNVVLNDFVGERLVADEAFRSIVSRRAAKWRLPPPVWARCGDAAYELNTPSGLLRVENFFGWHVTRDGAQLVWAHNHKPVFFHRLKDAQTYALLHARDRDRDFSSDGTLCKNNI